MKSGHGITMKTTCHNAAAKQAQIRHSPLNVQIRKDFRRWGILINGRPLKKCRDAADDKRIVKTLPRDLQLWFHLTWQVHGIRVQFGLTQKVKRIDMEGSRHESLNYIAGDPAGSAANDN